MFISDKNPSKLLKSIADIPYLIVNMHIVPILLPDPRIELLQLLVLDLIFNFLGIQDLLLGLAFLRFLISKSALICCLC